MSPSLPAAPIPPPACALSPGKEVAAESREAEKGTLPGLGEGEGLQLGERDGCREGGVQRTLGPESWFTYTAQMGPRASPA